MYELPSELRAKIHNYLMSRPMIEVEKLVNELRNLQKLNLEDIVEDGAE